MRLPRHPTVYTRSIAQIRAESIVYDSICLSNHVYSLLRSYKERHTKMIAIAQSSTEAPRTQCGNESCFRTRSGSEDAFSQIRQNAPNSVEKHDIGLLPAKLLVQLPSGALVVLGLVSLAEIMHTGNGHEFFRSVNINSGDGSLGSDLSH
jgi:hypothetical protein